MSKHILNTVIIVLITAFFAGCLEYDGIHQKEEKEQIVRSPFIEGLRLDNYPGVDGSTSTEPLNAIIACKILDIGYDWNVGAGYEWTWEVKPNLNNRTSKVFKEKIKSSQTHNSFIKLIDKKTDLILTARKMSLDEKAYADAAGISLIETPIALDAFIFIVNKSNPVESLTIKQIQDIYTGKITRWRDAGVNEADWEYIQNNAEINPYVRNANSGSQELMEALVLKDLETPSFPENDHVLVFTMAGALDMVARDSNAICYTVYYYKENIAGGGQFIKSIAVNGISPNKETIGNKSYPYTTEVYAVIRSDLQPSSMAYKIYEWIQTEEGKNAVGESGYVPY